ncbi:beta-galactosidase [Sphaerotilus sulfidivorans]|uniref:Beta-galactosidase n=1 Tax=Sphaerotilus sulfidivorans TaxID=639200 RepID=A0A5C1Q0T9_9BURK|nr:beta-galactosidase [Sphaerotilus sulfidivorans]NZD46873.1 beta-galactosidase [Sphaerotilus sulfidivorans]QEN00610.1 beta-galactosidase [Sphaerotilus sulfidivorans]
MQLGVCYYPEHWPRAQWAEDARRMHAMGIRVVRIAEFAWSVIEAEPGVFTWDWLDEAVETLHAAGLGVVMCTPTATPPKWLVDRMPDMVAIDLQGRPRGFGSRRHYCFSHAGYRAESRRISRAVAERYGQHPAVVAWQTDNEYGCHDTVLSLSESARQGFRRWLAARYTTIDALNTAWGTVFWSQVYRSFDEIDLPALTVTEAHPAHRLDWRRFSSDEVVAFNREQVAILRELSPGRPVSHNFMGFFTEFNHHDVAADLDIATWDSYPLGVTQMFFLSAEEKARWARTGHPDIPSFHHDLYRGMCRDGRWWVMEQQPGPVNWAHWNPAPHDGTVRLWTWQAFAHGAEVVSYFRWRQAPFAQEQMHTGLLRPDASEDQGAIEAAQVGAELAALTLDEAGPVRLAVQAPVAMVFDYAAIWMLQIQPQGADFNPLELQFRAYEGLRRLGLDVDLVPADADLSGYRLIVLAAQPQIGSALQASLEAAAARGAQIVLGPRAGSKSAHLSFPAGDSPTGHGLPPGPLSALAGVQVRRVASLPPGCAEPVVVGGQSVQITRWREDLALAEGTEVLAAFADGHAALTRRGPVRCVAGWLDADGWQAVLTGAAADAGLAAQALPEGLRLSRAGDLLLAFNFSDRCLDAPALPTAAPLLGQRPLPPRGLAIWRT